MKRILAIILTAFFILSLAACGDKTVTDTTDEEAVTGGWEVYTTDDTVFSTQEYVPLMLQSAIASQKDAVYTPVAYLGSQTVAGMNSAVLCTVQPKDNKNKATLKVLVFFIPIEGNNVELTKTSNFNIADYTESEGSTPDQHSSGGWWTAEDPGSATLPEDAQNAFDLAAADYDGTALKPMALLGTQVVAGTNYAFLCYTTTQEELGEANHLQVVTVYADLEGNAEITNVCTLRLSDFD